MRRIMTCIGLVGISALLLAGCTGIKAIEPVAEEVAETHNAEETDTKAIYISGERVELGPFEPRQDLNVIRPCEEIPEEVLEEIGFSEPENAEDLNLVGASACGSFLEDTDYAVDIHVSSTGLTPVQMQEVGYSMKPVTTTENYEIGLYQDSELGTDNCSAGIETARGVLLIDIVAMDLDQFPSDHCEVAEKKLTDLLRLLGEKNDN